ncbi:hypothetical protein NYS52_18075 [Curtobacterium flaccumfaciens pv. flaccumfaciens]|uniref:hypothetical protein n=1 Tax=Curtobacterium poinsettiae TaxID=159612 RepID=UPI00217D0F16|nr:hypothetical protein [Curtobacterium flaccumfaciens]MCS6576439.1 hypothetical protein [Curtobacterium flaccumfaciens pv. flaccumfaciens]
MTRKRILMAFAAIAVVAFAAAVIVIAGHLQQRGHDRAAATSTPIPTRSAAPTSKEIAHTVADRFCQPDASKNAWQRSLTPYLTAEAWQLYSAVRPGNVPCAGIHDDGSPVGDQQTSTDRAYQFTASTGGPVTVTLHRDTKTDPWLASHINAGGQE